MSTLFPTLFSPVRLGGLEIRNRVFSTGHMTSMLTDGLPNADFVAYHEARAAGGAGLIITESAAVHATSSAYNMQVFDDRCVPALERVAAAVRAHGCRLFGQLGHGGRESHSTKDGAAPVSYGPSQDHTERFHVASRALPTALVADIVRGYGEAAARYLAAGYDGVEIMASHALLPAQFLNPRVNRRTDAYGGSLANRMRFLREAIASVRDRVGRDLVLGVRISMDEMNHEGLVPEETLEVCQALDADGAIDFIDVIAGSMTGLAGAVHVVPPMNVDPGYLAPVAGRLRALVETPVLVAGRINQPHVAEAILRAGQADMCGMTRAQICDPEMASKAAADQVDDIRACIGCNQACIGHMQAGYPISCIQHPETGRERRYGRRGRAEPSRRVLVVGGGPAGMKAAAVAAERGHRVTLVERERELGGQVRLARALPGRAEFGGLVTNLAREMSRAGVTVRLGVEATRALVDAERVEAVVLATGARVRVPAIEGAESAHVVDAWQVIEDRVNVGARVVVADWRCDWVGMGVAEKLARAGCHVRLAVNGYVPGQTIQQYVRDRWVGDLHRLGVEIIPYARLHGVDEDTVYLQHTASGEPMLCEGVDTLVAATGTAPCTTLETALEGFDGQLLLAGDCLSPRTCEEAVLEGLRAGLAVGDPRAQAYPV
ncbi:MAG: FAD-dependent oxidoreductase [Ectothiorhodospiraceae bacterium]|nr:FAD-dependent oxidoreductase [Ectothiorhodospiraceae bacterium]